MRFTIIIIHLNTGDCKIFSGDIDNGLESSLIVIGEEITAKRMREPTSMI